MAGPSGSWSPPRWPSSPSAAAASASACSTLPISFLNLEKISLPLSSGNTCAAAAAAAASPRLAQILALAVGLTPADSYVINTRTLPSKGTELMEGEMHCRQLRYRLSGSPLTVHACHCRWCQRETGTAFALNALYEADRVMYLGGNRYVVTPSLSGNGQRIARCPSCRVSIWSNYPQAGPAVASSASAPLTSPTGYRRTSTSSPLLSSRGSCSHQAQRRWLSFMIWEHVVSRKP